MGGRNGNCPLPVDVTTSHPGCYNLSGVLGPRRADLAGYRFGRQGCISGTGTLLSRTAFLNLVGLRPLASDELLGTSHYSMDWGDGETLLAASMKVLQEWPVKSGLALHHDLAGHSRVVRIPPRPPRTPPLA